MSLIFNSDYRKGSINDKYGATATNTSLNLTKQPKGQALKSRQNGNIAYGAVPAINTLGVLPFSLECAFVYRGYVNIGSSYNGICGNGSNGISSGMLFSYGATELIYFFTTEGTNNTNVTSTSTLIVGKSYHLVGTFDGTTYKLYINSIKEGVDQTTIRNINTSNIFYVGQEVASTRKSNNDIYYVRVYNTALYQSEINTKYADFLASKAISKPKRGFIRNVAPAVNTIINEDFSDIDASGAVTVPNGWSQISGTTKGGEILVDSGTMKKGMRYLEQVTAGVTAIPCSNAYGTWEFDWMKGSDINVFSLIFLSPYKGPTIYTGSYAFYIKGTEALGVLADGNVSGIMMSATSYVKNNSWYRVRITRTTAGIFTMLIKGGTFTPTAGYNGWTLVSVTGGSGTNPVTDNTHTTSNYIVLDLDAGDRISNVVIKDGIIT